MAYTSVRKGIAQFVGALIDAVALLETAVLSIGTVIADVIYYIAMTSSPTLEGFVNYMTNSSATGVMWQGVMGFVATSFVDNVWNDFYENTSIGQYIDEHAIGIFKHDEIGCNVLSGIGFIAGIVIATIVTFGIAGAGAGVGAGVGTAAGSVASSTTTTMISTAFAAVSAFGKYTGESWNTDKLSSWEGIEEALKNGDISSEDYEAMKQIRDLSDEEWEALYNEYLSGNITSEQIEAMRQIREMPDDWKTAENWGSGIIYGGVNALWEGFQWYIGGFLGKITSGLGKIGAVIRVGVDSIFNTADTPFRSLITAATEGRDYGEVFEEKGGWTSVFTDFSIGLIGSLGGEIFDSITNHLSTAKLNELHDQLKTFMQQSDSNKQNLVEGIADNIPKELSIAEKARAAYIKLNQVLIYSDEYVALEFENGHTGNYSQQLAEIYYKQFDIKNMDTNRVVCNNWSQIYKDLLTEVGVDPKNIQIVGGNKVGAHKFVIIELSGGKIILADATNNIGGMTDIANSKLNLDTRGFIITTKDKYNDAYNTVKMSGKPWKWSSVFKILNQNADSSIALKDIDNQIGYESDSVIKEFNDVIDYYSNIPLKNQSTTEEKIEIFKGVLDENMGALEAFTVMRDYGKKLFGENTSVEFFTSSDKIIVVTTIFDSNGNKTYLYKINEAALQVTDDIEPVLKGVLR